MPTIERERISLMAKIRQRDKDSVLNALAGGVTPRQGIQFIQVGRKEETEALLEDVKEIESGGGSFRILDASFGSGKSFMLTLMKTVALKRNMLVMMVDLSPDRRLYSTSGKARNLYQELIRSLSSMTFPDGGALEELLDAVDDRISLSDSTFLNDIRRMPYGYDAVTIISKWHQARHPETKAEERDAFIVKDACLRWFASENTVAHKKLLGIKNTIGDDGTYDALKLIAMLSHYAGYGGLLVEMDECVNLYKINDSNSRNRNYEQILRMFNETRQGDAHHIGFIMAGTPEFVMDPRRGLFSYDALQTRLVTSQYSDMEIIDKDAPIIDLKPMPQESLFVLLRNIVNVDALGDEGKYVMGDDDITAYLSKCYETLGADYYRTPRELIRDFVAIVRRLEEHPELRPADVIGSATLTQTQRKSGMSAVMNANGMGTTGDNMDGSSNVSKRDINDKASGKVWKAKKPAEKRTMATDTGGDDEFGF